MTITIPGEPIGWGRPTPVARVLPDGRAVIALVTQEQTRAAKRVVREAFRRAYPAHRPWTGPVMLRFTAVFETPRSFNRALKDAAARGSLYCTKKPDKDNIEKLIKDALNGLVYVDDQQVMGGGLKRYGSPARVEISFETLDSPDVPPTPGQLRAERAQQATLPLAAAKGHGGNPTKVVSRQSLKVAPDLAQWTPHQRKLIEAAMARDEAALRDRRK